jgi:hypothetical protein
MAPRHYALHQPVEIDLLNMHAARIYGFHDMRAHIHAHHLSAATRDQRGSGQADIAKADDGDFLLAVDGHETILKSLWVRLRFCREMLKISVTVALFGNDIDYD